MYEFGCKITLIFSNLYVIFRQSFVIFRQIPNILQEKVQKRPFHRGMAFFTKKKKHLAVGNIFGK